jgi:RHS repeat-associated protein
MKWFTHTNLRRLSVLTMLTTGWLTVGPGVGSAVAQSRIRNSNKGHQRVLTPLELARIHGSQMVQDTAMIDPVDRDVDGQTGSTFPWEGGVGGLNTVNGNKLTSLPIVGWSGRGGMSVSLELFHNSQADGTSEIGQHWTHSYSIYGVQDPDTGGFSVRWGDGLGYKFSQNIDGSFSAPQGMADKLVADGTGWTLTTKNQVQYRFQGGTGNRKNCLWIKDRSGNQVTIAHNASDQVTSVTDPTGRVLTFTYTSGKLSSVTDPAGRVFTFTRNGSDDLTGVGFPMSTSIGYGYDASHRIVSMTDARGKVWTKGYVSGGNALAWEKDPLNRQTNYAYGYNSATITDPMGRVTTHNYASGGELSSITAPGNRTTSFAYTNYRKTSTTSPSGITGYLTYDSVGNVLTQTDALGNVTAYSYNAKNDVVSVSSPMGKTATNSYDGVGRLISSTDALGHSTSYTLNSYGLVTAVTNALGKTSTVSYDSNGNATSSTDPLGHTTSTTYNVLGMALTATDATGKTASTVYDSLGRTVSVTAPGSRTASFTYNASGQKLTTTNPLGQINSFVYNDAGQLVSHTDALNRTVSYGYNVAGQKTSFTDGRGKVTSYSYNAAGLPSGIGYPDGTSSSVTYNMDGQVATGVDGRGVVTTNNYNYAGQFTGVSYSDGTPSVSFAYNADGAKTSMTDGTGTTSYSYDGEGKPTNRTSPQGAVTYSYNAADALTGKVGGGSTLLYSYDDAGRMTTLVAGGSQTTSYSYDNANRMTSSTLPDGSVETKSYNTATDLASVVAVKSGTTITSSSYSYDSLGRKTSETTPSYAVAYTYDNGGQLTGENRTGASAYSISYSYDNAGNRASKTLGGTTESYSYDNANKLLTAGGKTYSYDGSGNMTNVSWSGGSTSLTWNGAGYLKSATTGGSTVNYAYNGIGQRVQKTGGVSASYILTDDSIDSEVLSDGAASFVRGASGLISENRGGTSKFYHADALGSVKALTNTSGVVTDARSTDAFGMVVTSSGSTPTPFGFAGNHGYQQDSETGLMRLGHRMYDASTGRFISRDPICAGYNWYTYCNNDPINAVDPTGLYDDPIIVLLKALEIDNDGSGPSHGDPNHQDQNDRTYPISRDPKTGKPVSGYPNADDVPYLVRRGGRMNDVGKGDFAVVIVGGQVVGAAFMDSRNTKGNDFEEGSINVGGQFGHDPGFSKKNPGGVAFEPPGGLIIVAFPGTSAIGEPGFIYDRPSIDDRAKSLYNDYVRRTLRQILPVIGRR